MTEKDYLRIKMKATLEGKKIARTTENIAYERLENFKERGLKLEGKTKIYNNILIEVLEEELNKKSEVYENMSYGGNIEGGIGYGGGGGSGTDSG